MPSLLKVHASFAHHRQSTLWCALTRLALPRRATVIAAFLFLATASLPQSAPPAPSPQPWVERAATAEQAIIRDDGSFPLQYRSRKVNDKGDTTRVVIESRDGSVARLIERNGQPLTPEEDRNERERLQAALSSPEEFARHHKRDAASRGYASDLVGQLPKAMLFTFTPGQPQPTGASGPQVVIDFKPDPAFRPPTMISEMLTGVAGRMWIDRETGHLTRAEARVLHPVNFGWGMLARIHEGGTIEFEQSNVGSGRWAYSHAEEHLVIREMLLKTAAENDRMTSYDFHLLPAPVSYQEAIHSLLAIPVATR